MHDINKKKILLVDDLVENLKLLVNIFHTHDYEIIIAKNGQEALDIVDNAKPDLILLDVNMPIKNGYEVCQELKENPHTKNIPIIFLTALNDIKDEKKGLALGAVDFITKPFSPDIVQARVKNHLELKDYQDNLEELVKISVREKENVQRVAIDALAILAEYRDNETGGHIIRTREYVGLLANHLKTHKKFKSYLNDENIEMLYNSAPLHDIGKVAIKDMILLKPDRLTEEEMEEMKLHAYFGFRALDKAERKLDGKSFLSMAKEMAYSHHERYDGTGYPRSLKGEDIPIPGRFMAVADVYDALISKRVYKAPFAHSKSVEIIASESGKAFDPDIVEAFLALQEDFRQTALQNADSELEKEALTK